MRPAIAAFAACLAIAIPQARALQGSYEEIQRGRYLFDVGDCASCHGESLAGGIPLRTPFGVIYSPNITTDPETGIGAWTDDQFYQAMHSGIAADGTRLYPAFPYPWFTKATRQDIDAIRAYLRTVPPVKARTPPLGLPFPFDIRLSMLGWNYFFFQEGTFRPDPAKSAEWNRGAYLVEGLAHCGACHTPTSMLGASAGGQPYRGGVLDNWYAPDLTSDQRAGLGAWSVQDIVDFLKTGRTDKEVAYGPMSEVIHYSTSRMTDADLKAMAVYLKDQPAARPNATPGKPEASLASAGEAIYVDTCSACHQSQGQGVPGMFPPLKSSAIVQSADPTTIIRLILNGGHAVATDQHPTPVSMPAFGWKLTNQQVAAVASYVRSAWGNEAPPVSGAEVQKLRGAVQAVASDD
jgi:mono/diheme cytochrome c family protein